jgi:hypothetical protein
MALQAKEPMATKTFMNDFFCPLASAIPLRIGASIATNKKLKLSVYSYNTDEAMLLPKKVVCFGANFSKNIGKMALEILNEYTEFAQSYMHQAVRTPFLFFSALMGAI